MANMSYCRFINTLHDLREAYQADVDVDELSDGEREAREKLLMLCGRIADDCADEIEDLREARRKKDSQ